MPFPVGALDDPTGALPPVVDGLEGGGGGCDSAPKLSISRQLMSNREYIFFILNFIAYLYCWSGERRVQGEKGSRVQGFKGSKGQGFQGFRG